jgi:cytochrome c oxidase subunit III
LQAKQALLAHHFDDIEQQRDAERLGMWIFLATEVLIFGALFTGYFVYRSWYPKDFEAVSGKLNVLIGAINTVVLLASSLTMALSVYAVRVGRQRMLINCLILTAALGTTFMVLKGIEYYADYRDGLVPNTDRFDDAEWTKENVSPQKVILFLVFYYVMTGLHAVHLTIGIGIIIWLIVRAWRGTLSPEQYIPVEVSGLYWHLIDVVWIFLLPVLYLTGTHQLSDFSHFM